MGLFTLVACSEDAYQEVDKRVETGTVENNSGGITPPTTSSGYNSPFLPAGSKNSGVTTTFRNNTPLLLELTPYGQDIYVQNFLSNNGMPYPPSSPDTPFFAFEGQSFFIMPGTVETNADGGAPLAVNAPPFTNSLGTIIYDFGSWSPNWRMYHYGKIYYFKYKIYNSMGVPFEEGYIRHQFYGELEHSADIAGYDPDWVKVANADGLSPWHDAVLMYHITDDEMCITNKPDYTTPPLLSNIPITDPATGTIHTLEFTSNASGIYVNFN